MTEKLTPGGLHSNVHRCTNWAQVLWNVKGGFYFYSNSLKLKGERLWVLSSPRAYLYGHLDDFAHMVIAAQDARKARYLHEMGGDGTKDAPGDIAYLVIRKGNALIAVRRNGEILVNERARTGDPYYSKAIARLEPVLKAAVTARPGLFS